MSEGKRRKTQYFDYSLVFIIVFLIGFGLVMLYSTSAYTASIKYDDSAYYLKKQLLAIILGGFAAAFLVFTGYNWLRKLSAMLYLFSAILCASVYVIGSNVNGSTRWIRLGPISFQPSELAKVVIIIFVAAAISNAPKKMNDIKQDIKVFAYVLVIAGIIAIENLSTAIIIAGIAFVMIFVANSKYAPFVMAILGIAAVGAMAILVGAGYRATRIKVWLNPEDYDEGYQTLQGLYAIGSGGFFGKGLGQSMQKLFVPEANNDMIFSIICEELGLFGAIAILVMYLILIWRFAYIATNAKDMFGSYIVIGIMTHIALQVILNVAVVTNTMPNTGITLPFISYGGTSMTILVAEMGLALAVSKGIEFD